MKRIEWDEANNRQLQEERNLSFEAIVIAIELGKLLDVIPNPSNQHANQNVLVIEIDNYVVLVPFVEDAEKIFLKTAFRSSKMMKNHRRKINNEKT